MDKTFDAAKAEGRIYARWEEQGCFAAGANASRDETYCIVIPPPNVTGSLHMGHALNNTLQDVLIRWKRMQGYDVLWQPGTDHAGIATQMVVERKLAEEGKPGRRDMGREAFVETVWDWKHHSGGQIENQLKRLGASCDWSRDRFTMDEGLSRAVLKVFVQLYHEGLIYRDKRLVNWDPHFETAISDLEVEQVEQKGNLWNFRYQLADGLTFRYPVAHDDEGNPSDWEERDYIVVATTRPETYLGDTAVAVHADDPRYRELIGKDVILPMVGRRIPIIADEHADPTKGTGAVKITPAHDFNDFQVGKRHNLRQINILDSKAHVLLEGNEDFLDGCEPSPDAMILHGKDRYEARKRIVKLAEEQGWLDGIDTEMHVVPHGDRSKAAIEPWLTDQWFVDAETLAKPAIEYVRNGTTNFVPKNWENTYFHWMENIEPWCISRQLWWGHQVPVWYGPPQNVSAEPQHHTADGSTRIFVGESFEAVRKQAAAVYTEGNPEIVEAASDATAWGIDFRADGAAQITLCRDPDVLDTWFSSALWPFSTLGWPDQTPELARYYPTSVLVTGFDIIFFWVARMMMDGLHFMKDGAGRPLTPFDTVYVHALVRDEHGKKMSKSLGNVIDPLELIDQYGADALRFTLTSMAAMGRDIKLAVSRVEGYRNFGTKLWNAARFAEMNECKPVAGFDPRSVTRTVNKWIVGETARIAAATEAALEGFRFNDAANGLYAHIWGVFCDWYVELSKPLLQGEDKAARDETRATMAWALDECLKLLHPIMPFVTEELWGQIAARDRMLVHAGWPELPLDLEDAEADAEMGWVIRVIEGVRSVRSEMNVPAGAQIEMVVTGAGTAVDDRLARNGELIRRLARLSGIARAEQAPKGSVTLALDDCALSLPLAGVIDVAAEQARLDRAMAKLVKEIDGLEGKLANEKFLAKAPEHIVTEQRERLAAAGAEREKLDAALARLAELE